MNQNNERKSWSTRRLALAGFPFFAGFIMLFHGCRDIDIALHEASTTATVTGSGSHDAIFYVYHVGGDTYTGTGDPGHEYAPFPVGSTFDIRYSTIHPSRSTAHHPLRFIGEIAVAWVFLGWLLYLHHSRTTKPRTRNA